MVKSLFVVAQFDCHPEQASFVQGAISADRAICRAVCDSTIAGSIC